MPISYGSGAPEVISYSFQNRDGSRTSYNAVSNGRDQWRWDRRDEAGDLVASGTIANSNKWQATVHLCQQAMRDHDLDRQPARSSPVRDRIVSVDENGRVGAATIIPRR
ncbi:MULTISPECIES: hypothetical protein [unclassified Bradyrhizobium]|uniref:hypothetical protein n=1 Tax=unclassified Bradyrhizobium TaxID=2631580 RepID=UPI0028E2A6DE|nr:MULTISPECIES: hypothetical protein [unclassified Bradyrhizobium]